MSLLKRYDIKYQSEFDKKNIVNNIKSQIEKIYNFVVRRFYDDETQHVILTGSGALFLYITELGYEDLLDKLPEPSDVDLLLVLNSKKIKTKPHFSIYYIEDFRRVKKAKVNGSTVVTPVEPANATLESSVSFKDFWTSDKINEFDLTYVFSSGVHYNKVNNFNLIKLDELLQFYEADKDNTERAGKDYIKIELIKEIIKRLQANPRPDIISSSPAYTEIDTNKIKNLGKLTSPITFSKRKLFDDDLNMSPSNSDIMETPVSKFKPSKLFGDDDSEIKPTKLFDDSINQTPTKNSRLVDEFAPISESETKNNSSNFIPKIIERK